MILLFLSCTSKSKTKESEVKKEIPLKQPSALSNKNKKYLREQDLISYITTADKVIPKRTIGAPFDTLQFDKAIAYDFEGNDEPYSRIVDKNGKFVPVVLKQQFLTQAQTDRILSKLTKISTYGKAQAFCFTPHFALLLFRENKIVDQINVCLDCNYLISDIKIPAENHYKAKIGKDFEYPLAGFSKSGKKGIIDLCKELDFYYGKIEIK
jgi:hypothetical protein